MPDLKHYKIFKNIFWEKSYIKLKFSHFQMKILINRWKSWNRKITILTTVYKEIPLKTGRHFLSTKKLSMKKSWKNIFSSNIKNRYLELKHIQRRASDSFSKYSNMSIVYFFAIWPISIADFCLWEL